MTCAKFLPLRAMLACLMVGTGLPATALEDIKFQVTSRQADLGEPLGNASLLLKARADGNTEPEDLLAAARADYRQLLGALYEAGFYGGTISIRIDGREAATLSPLTPPGRIDRIRVVVDPGPQFRFGRAGIGPLAIASDRPAGFSSGQPARSGLVSDAASAAVDGWRAAGYAKVRLESQRLTADHADARLDVDLRVAPGPRLRFGPLRISGNERVRTERIRQIAGLPVGETYSPEALDEAARRLRRTGAFRSVRLSDAEAIGPGNTLPIHASVIEEKRRRLGTGIEYSTTEGVTLSGFWLHRNLRGGAERLRVDAEISGIGGTTGGADYGLGADFRRPATFSPDTDLTFSARIERVDDPGFSADTVEIGGAVEHIFSERLTGSAGLFLRAGDVTDAFGNRNYQLAGLPLALTWDGRDSEIDPTKGIYADLSLIPFAGLGNMESGARLTLDARTYRAIGERVVLAGRAQLGALTGPSIANAPPDYLFFAGGGGSVRGQDYQALGSGSVSGTVVGGRSYLALSAEARIAVTDTIGVVGFYDAGYIGSEEFPNGSGSWISGAGFGLRYQTGLGPLRLDIGLPVSGTPAGGSEYHLYIGIGQAF